VHGGATENLEQKFQAKCVPSLVRSVRAFILIRVAEAEATI
jgi:hypothetical protein